MAGFFAYEIKGTREMRAKAAKLNADARRAMLNAVKKFQHQEGVESDKRVPVLTGELKESKFEVEPYFQGNQVVGGLGYGADHALVVHEDLEAFHPHGQAKYLESVINESAPHFPDRVAEEMKKETGM